MRITNEDSVDDFEQSSRLLFQGRRFIATHQTQGTTITGQTSFAATTPTFLLRQNATTVRVVIRNIALTTMGTAPGGNVNIAVVVDTANRFSAGGAAVVPQNLNEASATASGITSFLTNPTATAEGATHRVVTQTGIGTTVPTTVFIDYKDGLFLSVTSSLLVYTWAASTAPSWLFNFEWSEL